MGHSNRTPINETVVCVARMKRFKTMFPTTLVFSDKEKQHFCVANTASGVSITSSKLFKELDFRVPNFFLVYYAKS